MLTLRMLIEVGIFLAFSAVAACLLYDAYTRRKKRKSRKKKIPPGTLNAVKSNEIEGNHNQVAINHNYTPNDAFSIEFLRATIEAQQKTIDRLYEEKEKLTEENDMLWNEVIEYKYTRANTIPIIRMPETNKKI